MTKAVCWSLIGIYFAVVIVFAWKPDGFAQSLAAVAIVATFVSATITRGWQNALALLLICLLITFALENIGTATGFPFGHYHFQVAPDLPHVGAIPLIVGPLWFGMGYCSWVIASTLLDKADQRLDERPSLILLPTIAAFVMTQWDLVMDPPESTISHAWVWHNGGGDFGVPLSNYLGWYLTAWLFSFGFAIYLRVRKVPAISPAQDVQQRLFCILLYLASGLTHITPWLIGQTGIIDDMRGYHWNIADLRESRVAVLLFTMVFTSILALTRLLGADRQHSAQITPRL